MKQQFLQQPAVKRTLLAVALAMAYGNASALTLPEFTWNPAGAGLTGTAFTADNIIVSDFATVTFTSRQTFHEEGYLGVSSFQFAGKDIAAGGLNSTYSLYFHFTGDGVVNGPFTLAELPAVRYELGADVRSRRHDLRRGRPGSAGFRQPGLGRHRHDQRPARRRRDGHVQRGLQPVLRHAAVRELLQHGADLVHQRRGHGHDDRQRLHDRQRRRLAALCPADPGARDVCPDDGRAWGPGLHGLAAKARLMRSQ